MKKKSTRGTPQKKNGFSSELTCELKAFMAEHGLDELMIEDGKARIDVRLGAPLVGVPIAPRPVETLPPVAAPATQDSQYLKIRSPMAGTFYRSSSPSSPSYANEGDRVTPTTTVCIIEAMKVMNEIKAECSGKIVKICADNAQPIESGAILFEVDPAG